MRLIAPFYRCRINDDEFKIGDGTLLEVSVELGEEQRASRCSFTIYDRNLLIGARYQILSLKSGGIETPPNLIKNQSNVGKDQSFTTKGFEDPSATPSTSGAGSQPISTTLSTSGGTVSTQNPPFSPQIRAFMDLIAYKEVHSDVTLSIKGYYSNNDVAGSNGFFDDADIARGGGFPASAGHSFNVGRYQFKYVDWKEARAANPNIKGYSPADQDLVCLWKMQAQNKGYKQVLAGDIRTAIRLAGQEWQSLPGSGQVQRGYTVEQAIAYYNERLRVYTGQNQRTMVVI